jgi:hypothetical protein
VYDSASYNSRSSLLISSNVQQRSSNYQKSEQASKTLKKMEESNRGLMARSSKNQ